MTRPEAREGRVPPTWLYRDWDQRMQLRTRRATKANLGVPDHMMVDGKRRPGAREVRTCEEEES